MRALLQRVSRARRARRRRDRRGDRARACSCCSASRRGDGEQTADRLAEKVRALRVFPDADGRMNEPLGEREVLCVSQFTLCADTRRGNRPSFAGAAAPGSGRAAVRALLRAARRGARALRRAHGDRARRRRARHDPAGSNLIACPTTDDPQPRSADARRRHRPRRHQDRGDRHRRRAPRARQRPPPDADRAAARRTSRTRWRRR